MSELPPSSAHASSDSPASSAPAIDRRWLLGGLTGAVGLAAIANLAKGGPLTPPAGAVAPTGKTLGAIEPRTALGPETTPGSVIVVYRITQPGSYYLAGNVEGVAGKHGIEIAASNVTLDLNGFTVQGAPGSADGIFSAGAYRCIRVHNGVVRGWGGSGVTFYAGAADRTAAIERIVADANAGAGISADFSTSITACTATGNGSQGINVGTACIVDGCAVSANGGDGVRFHQRCRITGNVAVANALATTAAGFTAAIATSGPNHVEGNAAYGNGCGYRIFGGNNLIVRNTASGNTLNWEISTGNHCLVLTTASAPAFSGNSGGTAIYPVPYDPNANFTL